jgi:hypothetical protein
MYDLSAKFRYLSTENARVKANSGVLGANEMCQRSKAIQPEIRVVDQTMVVFYPLQT